MSIKAYFCLLTCSLALFCFYIQNNTTQVSNIESTSTRDVLFIGRPESTNHNDNQHTYRLQVPMGWVAIHPVPSSDTTHAILHLVDPQHPKIRCDIHSFPIDDINQRIPPEANCKRWNEQFSTTYRGDPIQKRFSAHGFSGLCFECSGQLNDKEQSMLAYSILMSNREALERQRLWISKKNTQAKQSMADLTIKVTGPVEELHSLHKTWDNIVASIELMPID